MNRQASIQSPLQKLISGESVQKLCKNKYQRFLVLSNFALFSYFRPYILSLTVEIAMWEKMDAETECWITLLFK